MNTILKLKTLLSVGLVLLQFHVEARLDNYPRELASTVEALEKLPEAQELIADVQKSGPVKIVYLDMPGQSLEGFWNASARQIEVNKTAEQSKGRLLSTILFELHNAQTSQRLIQITDLAKHNMISKDEFVSGVEQMEYRNAKHASYLLEKGIRMGFYPKDASWPIYNQFEDHYRLQQILDHSKWLANHYDRLNPLSSKQPLKGTIPGLGKFSEQDKNDFLKYLAIKNDLESPSDETKQKAFTALTKEYGRIEACSKGAFSGDCSRNERKLELLGLVFANNPVYKELVANSDLAKR